MTEFGTARWTSTSAATWRRRSRSPARSRAASTRFDRWPRSSRRFATNSAAWCGTCRGNIPVDPTVKQRQPTMENTMRFRTNVSRALMQLASVVMFGAATAHAAPMTAKEASDLGVEAYIYGYPLVTMEYTRRVIDQRREPEGTTGSDGPVRDAARVSRMRRSRTSRRPTPTRSTPTAWLDVAQGAWSLSLPDMKDRYFLMPMLDGWTDVFQVPGKRTTGTGAQTYAITGPGWKGDAARRRQGIQIADRAWCGSSAGPTAPARRRTTRPCTRCRTRCRSCR